MKIWYNKTDEKYMFGLETHIMILIDEFEAGSGMELIRLPVRGTCSKIMEIDIC